MSHRWCFKYRTTWTRPWISPKLLLGCWLWTTCCTWPRFTRTRTSGLVLPLLIFKNKPAGSFISSPLTDRAGEQQPRGQTRMPLRPVCHRAHQDVVWDPPGWRIAWVHNRRLIKFLAAFITWPRSHFIGVFPSSLPSANEGCNDYHPMFFTHDRAWEEFFCVCIQLLNKTWKEMRATAEDFNKVGY